MKTAKPNCGAQPPECQTRIEIYTDGSCIGNPGHGGWGAVTLRKDADGVVIKTREDSDFDLETTNIRMEMTAVITALERLGKRTAEPITIYCDANLIPKAMTQWLAGWKRKGWTKSDGQPVSNKDLWQRLERAVKDRVVDFQWVRGHAGNEYNERADRLAYAASRRAEAKILESARKSEKPKKPAQLEQP